MSSTSNQMALKHKVLVEQIKLLYQSLLPVIVINLVISLALVYTLWTEQTQRELSIWMGLMLLVLLMRAVTYYIYHSRFKSQNTQRYALYFTLGSAASDLVWGIGGVALLIGQSMENQLFTLFVLGGMAGGSLSILSIYLPAFYAFFPAVMLPMSIWLFLADTPIHMTLGIMSITFTFALSYFVVGTNRSHKYSLALRFENIDLVQQLREQKKEADHINIAKSKFLGAASHDLRQPLYALSLFTSVLDESTHAPKVRRVVEQIKASVQSLQSLFNALLDISQLDAGVMQVEKTDFYLVDLFTKLSNDFDAQAQEKGLNIVWPECAFAIHSDQNMLEQILSNFISNAIRYTNADNIKIICEKDRKMITIAVIDSGMGIPEMELEAIFDEFHQLSNPERNRDKGLGLGLAIVRRTAKLLGHTINVASEFGKGSIFSVKVGQANNAVIATAIPPDEPQIRQDVLSLILVIDDEASVRDGTKELFRAWGCDVIAAANKNDLLAQLKQQNRTPNGIIVDYRLHKNQTGIETINAIHKEYNNKIPALIVTGDIAIERLREVNNSGFQMLHKPVAAVKLRTFLRHVQRHQKKMQKCIN